MDSESSLLFLYYSMGSSTPPTRFRVAGMRRLLFQYRARNPFQIRIHPRLVNESLINFAAISDDKQPHISSKTTACTVVRAEVISLLNCRCWGGVGAKGRTNTVLSLGDIEFKAASITNHRMWPDQFLVLFEMRGSIYFQEELERWYTT